MKKRLLVAFGTLSIGSAVAQGLLPGEREVTVTAIPGVVAAGAEWEIVWADFETADGIVGTADGGTCSATAIRSLIKKLVEAEKPSKPISDSTIADILADQGIHVARRTVAKYREALNIPPSSQRKSLV